MEGGLHPEKERVSPQYTGQEGQGMAWGRSGRGRGRLIVKVGAGDQGKSWGVPCRVENADNQCHRSKTGLEGY